MGSPAVVCTDTTKMAELGALINCQKSVFYVPLADSIGRKISQELRPFGDSQHFLLPILILQLFCCCFRRKQEAWSLWQKRKINHIFWNFPVESVCQAPTMYFAKSVKFLHQIVTEENMKSISCKNNQRIWSGDLRINLVLGGAELPISKSRSGKETEGPEGSK